MSILSDLLDPNRLGRPRAALRRPARSAGRVLVLVVVGLVALIGFAGISVDVASWYRQQRA